MENLKTSQAKIRYKGKIRKVPVYHITQENCIFVEAERSPKEWTSPEYQQTHCVTARTNRLNSSKDVNPVMNTKIWKVPADQFFKIRMTVSNQMNNRTGEFFGIQIIKESGLFGKHNVLGSNNVFTQGGWKPGDQKTTKAIRLKKGRYYWRCPANPTVWYAMIAQ